MNLKFVLLTYLALLFSGLANSEEIKINYHAFPHAQLSNIIPSLLDHSTTTATPIAINDETPTSLPQKDVHPISKAENAWSPKNIFIKLESSIVYVFHTLLLIVCFILISPSIRVAAKHITNNYLKPLLNVFACISGYGILLCWCFHNFNHLLPEITIPTISISSSIPFNSLNQTASMSNSSLIVLIFVSEVLLFSCNLCFSSIYLSVSPLSTKGSGSGGATYSR